MTAAGSRVLVIGPGPAVIGEGGELDAACLDGVRRLRERGHEVVFVTSNPATASSDPEVAARTYLEPLDEGALRAIVEREKPAFVLPLLGGPRALALAALLHDDGSLAEVGASLLGVDTEAAHALAKARTPAAREALAAEAAQAQGFTGVELVLALDRTGAARDVAAVESLDRASVHPGDAVSVTPPVTLSAAELARLEKEARAALDRAHVRAGLAVVELAIHRARGEIRVLGVALGCSRTTALAAQATGLPLAEAAVDLALGKHLAEALPADAAAPSPRGFVVRWPRFAFETFPDADAALGATRKSIGESLGTGATLAEAIRAAARAADDGLAVPRPIAARQGNAAGGKPRVLVLGAGPSRIGAGPELAVSAREALLALRELGFEGIFVDSSPEALAVAASGASAVRVEPMTLERVLAVYAEEGACGVVVQVGGDTALRLAADLEARGAVVLGTKPAALARALDPARLASPPSLDEATAFDVDAIADGTRAVVVGVTEHLEPAFVHGGDAAATLPPCTANPEVVARIEELVRRLAVELGIVGCLTARVAVSDATPFLVGVEPRAGRTSPFVTRATGVPLVRIATKLMLGKSLDELGVAERPVPRHVSARERVFPFEQLGVDTALGAEMRSTGEAVGIDDTPARAYAKALRGIGVSLRAPRAAKGGGVLVDVTERDRSAGVELARRLRAIGFEILARGGTRAALTAARLPFRDVGGEAEVEPALAEIRGSRVAFAIVTARGAEEISRTRALRGAALAAHVACFTTVALARLAVAALEEDASGARIGALQDWYAADR